MAMEAGIWKTMRFFDPETVDIDVAVVVPEGPPPAVAGWKLTVTLAAGMLPLGKSSPVTLMDPASAWPVVGCVRLDSVTSVSLSGSLANSNEPENRAMAASDRL